MIAERVPAFQYAFIYVGALDLHSLAARVSNMPRRVSQTATSGPVPAPCAAAAHNLATRRALDDVLDDIDEALQLPRRRRTHTTSSTLFPATHKDDGDDGAAQLVSVRLHDGSIVAVQANAYAAYVALQQHARRPPLQLVERHVPPPPPFSNLLPGAPLSHQEQIAAERARQLALLGAGQLGGVAVQQW